MYSSIGEPAAFPLSFTRRAAFFLIASALRRGQHSIRHGASPAAALFIEELCGSIPSATTPRQGRVWRRVARGTERCQTALRQSDQRWSVRGIRGRMPRRVDFGDDLTTVGNEHRFTGPRVADVFAQTIF
jgi:hypothetical protein